MEQSFIILCQGEELGMTDGHVPWVETRDPLACMTDDPVGYLDVTRDHARTPFPWISGKNGGNYFLDDFYVVFNSQEVLITYCSEQLCATK